MAEYVCRLGTPGGEVVTRTLEANAERELRQKLEREGFHVFAISSKAAAAAGGSIFARRLTKRRIKPSDFLTYNQQLASLLRAGIPILQAIQILTRRQANEDLRVLLQDVEERIKTGQPLSEAFAAQGVFPRIYVASVLAGERSGSLDEVLARYVAYAKSMAEIVRKLRKALTYPVILVVASLILLTVLTTFVIPQFANLYGSVGDLPTITVVVVGVSNFIQSYFLIIIAVVVGGSVAFYLWRRTAAGRLAIDATLLATPILGNLIRDLTTARFSRSMSTLLAGGLTVPDAVEIASDAITNRELARKSEHILTRVREGKPFVEGLEEADWIPELALDMIGVGESSGALQPMFEEVANFFDAESDVRLSALTTIIEPVILVVMGTLVMFILLAVYLPILTLIGKLGTGQ